MRVKPVVEPVTSPDMLIFDDILALESHGFSTLLVPGLAVDIRLNWLVLEQPHEDYRVQLGLARSPEGESFFEQSFEIWPDVYPPTQWVRGERVTTLHRLEIPADLAVQDKPFLTLQLLPEDGEDPLAVSQGDSALAEMQPVLREHHFALPEIGNPLDARFGEEIRLLGYDLDATEVRSGTELQLTLYWQAITTPGKGYTVFNHVLGADGQIWGQFDSPPVGDAWLTTSWLPGEIIEERRTIPIREDAPAGEYRLLVGLYTVGDGLRAPVFLDGERQPDDQLELSGLTILP